MPQRLRRFLPEFSYLRKWLILSSGAVAGQALVVISSPLLTRLFTPEEFGLFAVFAAVVGITGTICGLRYESAVPLASSDEDAAAIAAVVILSSGFLAAVSAVFVWLIGDWFSSQFNDDKLGLWLWLLPPALLIWGGGSALSNWSVRRRTYGVNALNRTMQFGAQTAGQLAMGIVGWGTLGLILGYLSGYVVRFGHFFVRLPVNDRILLADWRLSRITAVFRTYWRYPVFSLPSAFLGKISQLGPAIIVAAMFGPAVAGFYALAQRVVGLPIRTLGEAAGQVFLGELRGLERPALRRLFLRTLVLFGVLAMLVMMPLLFFAPWLFRVVFGEGWAEAGVFVQLLIPLYAARLIAFPAAQLLNSLNLHHIQLSLTITNLFIFVAVFATSYFLSFSVFVTIFLFSSLQTLVFSYRLWQCWRIIS